MAKRKKKQESDDLSEILWPGFDAAIAAMFPPLDSIFPPLNLDDVFWKLELLELPELKLPLLCFGFLARSAPAVRLAPGGQLPEVVTPTFGDSRAALAPQRGSGSSWQFGLLD